MIDDFHFLRPWWLVGFVAIIVLVWAIRRRQNAARAWDGIVAAHLLPFLLRGRGERMHFSPLLMIGAGWAIACVSIAGPAWRREPSPFAEDTASLAIVMKVTPSMTAQDVQPSRLARAAEKIHDLLHARRGARTAIIAYAGTAHVVMPLTSDGGIIDTFAQALDPKIMPADGDVAAEALALADQALAASGSGSILWIADGVGPEQSAPLAEWRSRSQTPVRLLPPLLAGEELEAIREGARNANATVVRLTADDSDVATLARAAKYSTALTREVSGRWEESGYWLTPIVAALLLPFYRKGWMAQTAARG